MVTLTKSIKFIIKLILIDFKNFYLKETPKLKNTNPA